MPKISLQKRERIVVGAGLVIIAITVAYQVAQGPWKAYQQSIIDVKNAEQLLHQARLWNRTILEARGGEQAVWRKVQARGPNFDLFSFLHRLVGEKGLENRYNIRSLPRAEVSERMAAVDMTLDGVSLEELVDFLHAVYAGDNLVVLYRLAKLEAAPQGVGLTCHAIFVSPKTP